MPDGFMVPPMPLLSQESVPHRAIVRVMNNSTYERRQTVLFRFVYISAIVMLFVVLITAGFELYVRWFVNKDFILLGGFELEALTISVSALILGMAYLYRPINTQS